LDKVGVEQEAIGGDNGVGLVGSAVEVEQKAIIDFEDGARLVGFDDVEIERVETLFLFPCGAPQSQSYTQYGPLNIRSTKKKYPKTWGWGVTPLTSSSLAVLWYSPNIEMKGLGFSNYEGMIYVESIS
jgi:hypothetical protein